MQPGTPATTAGGPAAEGRRRMAVVRDFDDKWSLRRPSGRTILVSAARLPSTSVERENGMSRCAAWGAWVLMWTTLAIARPVAAQAENPGEAGTAAPQGATAQSTTTQSATVQSATAPDGQHDFDFEFGSWKAHLKRLVHPLSGSHTWVELDGTSTVRKVWDGRANLGELEVAGTAMHVEGLSLRLYNPETRQWSIYIYWSNSRDGAVGSPMIGRFANGRGEFYNQDTLDGRAIFVRFLFSDITATSFQLEQAFSADGGKTWEPNWLASFTRPPA